MSSDFINERQQLDMGKHPREWQLGLAKTVTFIVTENCQLRCKYCYIHGKNHLRKMDFAIAKQTVDYLIENRSLFTEPSVIWEFIGGEPLLEIDLIDRISDYIKYRMYETDHPWFNNYRFNFSTNGLLYADPKVQQYIDKNLTHISIGISLDGTKAKHDAQRVYPDGSGSYDDILRNIPLWLKQFPNASTKATIAHDDLPYIKDSVLHLWELGITSVNMNVIFEDVWRDGDDDVFEQQLIQLADHIIQYNLYTKFTCSLFSELIGHPLNPLLDNHNWCGAGKMLAIDMQGVFYPCIRFAPFSLTHKPARVIGDITNGIDRNALRPFLALNRTSQSPQQCIDCEVASGCAWCPGYNYDVSETDTIYQRATSICSMHKARARANKYYYAKLNEKIGTSSSVHP